jgi:AcrR family transcriptional regulator
MRVSEEYIDQKRHDIGRVAMRLYCEQGQNVSVAAICKEAGIAKGSLFRYFPSRDEMFRQLFNECRAHALELSNVDLNLSEDASDEQILRALIRNSFHWPTSFPLEFQYVVMYTEFETFYIFGEKGEGPVSRDPTDPHPTGVARYRFDALDNPRYRDVLERSVREGLPVDLAAREVSALVNEAARYLISLGQKVSDDLIEAIVSSVFDAVFKPSKKARSDERSKIIPESVEKIRY